MSDFADILDAKIDDLQDLPEFRAWPTGTYLISVESGIEERDQDGKVVEVPKLVLRYKDTLDLADDKLCVKNEVPAPEGTAAIHLTLFMHKKTGERNPFAEGTLKQFLQAVAELYPEAAAVSNRELINAMDGTELAISTKYRARMYEGEQREENKILAVVPAERASELFELPEEGEED